MYVCMCRSFVIDENTVDSVTYDDWVTSAGTIPHTVTRLVTPAVRVSGCYGDVEWSCDVLCSRRKQGPILTVLLY